MHRAAGKHTECPFRRPAGRTASSTARRFGWQGHAGLFACVSRQDELLTAPVLLRLTEKTIVDPDVLRKELAQIRQQGYAVSYGEWILDASGIAAPIFDRNGEIAAALTISGPTQRFTEEILPIYISQVLEPCSRKYFLNLGFTTQSLMDQPDFEDARSSKWGGLAHLPWRKNEHPG